MYKVRSLSSKKWLKRHISDKYVNLAYNYGIRSRAHFKLSNIDSIVKLFRRGMTVIDLGCSPGSWSEYAIKKVGKTGCVISCDILPMKPIKGVFFVRGNIREPSFLNWFLIYLKNKRIDLVMSDMAPNMSGIDCIDHPRSIELGLLALKISEKILTNNGKFLVKTFCGEQFNELILEISALFITVKVFKPSASRMRSREIYIIAFGRKR
ncbi:RlmE family RNA methyltransferase [Buchnera aphidicola]|uniref:Ribosomal RNA large subunit methyltransferase E n=1 Tax=Buchnera aphidicola subsp. Melaphis rhois TaxID=118103 RepID=A0A4D6Y447_BUCMH|nr:SAM-dependent methyltransferase [Buchnera aphidicola]QCI23363.1 hypothetical protein D9V73_01770 [Buchnera aphidicola (Melaphis rhois)]